MHPVLAEIVGWEALLVLLVIALLFGTSKLPALARSLGEASREFKKGLADDSEGANDPKEPPASPGAPPAE